MADDPIRAQLHDGRILEFPAGTDASVIQNTVKKMLGVQSDPAALAKEAAGSLKYQMGQAGAQPAQSLPSYAAQSLIEGAPSTAGAIAGAPGGIPGMMAGAGAGEAGRQAAHSLANPSVMPGVPNQPLDYGKIAGTAAITGAIPAGLLAGSKLVGALKDKFAVPVMDLFKQGGEKDLAVKFIRDKLLSEETSPAVLQAAKQAAEIIPGGKPTMAQVVGHLPEGSPIQAHQMTIAKNPKGVSAAFGERTAKQQVAEAVADRYAKTMTVPKGLEALDRANAQGGVPVTGILQGIDAQMATPQVEGAPITQKALEGVKEFLASKADQTGNINAHTLYEFKKQGVNQVVSNAFDKTDPKLTEEFRAIHLSKVKKMIDDAIEQGGGTGWKDYLIEMAGRKENIKQAVLSRENQYKPLQKTNLADPEIDKLQIANVLDRPISYINAAIRHFKGDVRPRLNKEFEHLYLDPQYYHQQMSHVPLRYRPMIEALMKQTGGVAGAQIGSQLAQKP